MGSRRFAQLCVTILFNCSKTNRLQVTISSNAYWIIPPDNNQTDWYSSIARNMTQILKDIENVLLSFREY